MSKILICDPIGKEGIGFLRAKGCEVVLRPDITAAELTHAVSDVDAIIVRSRTQIPAPVIARAKQLKAIARSGTGVDNIDCDAARKRKIFVINAPGANSESVAEHVFGMLLTHVRHLVATTVMMRKGGWPKHEFSRTELLGKTIGIVGYGHIGQRVTEIALAFGMNILVYNRTTNDPDKAKHLARVGGSFVSLETLMKESDFVTLHVTLTPQTRGLVGEKLLASMKQNAILVNASRGPVVDEKALIDALETKKIAGAILDVFETEPLADDSPLRVMDSVLLSPHVAADSSEGENRASRMIAEDIIRVLSGKNPLHMVR